MPWRFHFELSLLPADMTPVELSTVSRLPLRPFGAGSLFGSGLIVGFGFIDGGEQSSTLVGIACNTNMNNIESKSGDEKYT